MASRNANASPSVEQVAGALKRANLSDGSIRPPSHPPGGVAGRRRGIGFKLGDITGAGSSPSAAGLGAGRPTALDAPFEQPPVRRNELGTPFANFGKIV